MRQLALAAALALAAGPSVADLAKVYASLEAARLVHDLGMLIAAQSVCGFEINHDAIIRFVEVNMATDELTFASSLRMEVDTAQLIIGQVRGAEEAAHCHQAKRAAQANGLLAE